MKVIESQNKQKEEVIAFAKMTETREAKRVQAAIIIQRAYRRYCFRKHELRRLSTRNSQRRERDEYHQKEKAEIFRRTMLIKKVQRFWRARQEARKNGTVITNPFRSSIDSFKKSRSFKGLYGPENTVKYAEDVTCVACKQKLAAR